ncbi:hypothetical protein PAI11_17800 [Patulibacter medicamentivorans]|uniref:Uncharacterized protein n=1 Tax=Patulibacter medicamentivorans TaxID=1097667 RepID=H0E4P9_9ACTN|nr:hypothetical protein PAI11_17800 [Patulibacter medicamentivorans]
MAERGTERRKRGHGDLPATARASRRCPDRTGSAGSRAWHLDGRPPHHPPRVAPPRPTACPTSPHHGHRRPHIAGSPDDD